SRENRRAQGLDVDRAGGYVGVQWQVHALDRGHDRGHHPVAEVRVDQSGPVGGGGQVADLNTYSGHAGEAQQGPGLRVVVAVGQAGTGHDLALDQAGQALADGGADAVAGAVVVGRHALGGRVGVAVEVQGDQQVGAEAVGQVGALVVR